MNACVNCGHARQDHEDGQGPCLACTCHAFVDPLEVAGAIRRRTYVYASEEQLQQGIAQALTLDGYDVQREVRLTARDRIDLLVGGVGVEVKAKPVGAYALVRQLARYAASDQVQALVLVTNRARQRVPAGLADRLGVPFGVVVLVGV